MKHVLGMIQAAPTGPLLDHLLTKHGILPASCDMTGQPSEDVIKKFLKGKAKDAENAAGMLKNPDLLQQVYKTDKRLGVRYAAACNPHMPLTFVKEEIQTIKDTERWKRLIGARSSREKVELILSHENLKQVGGYRLTDPDSYDDLAHEADGYQLILSLGDRDLNAHVGLRWYLNDDDAATGPGVELLKESRLGRGDVERLNYAVETRDLDTNLLLDVPNDDVHVVVLTLALRNKDEDKVRYILNRMSIDGLVKAVYTLHCHKWVVDEALARTLMSRPEVLSRSTSYTLNVTNAAADILGGHPDARVGSQYLTHVKDPKVLYELVKDRDLSHWAWALPVSTLNELWKLGLPVDKVERLLGSDTDGLTDDLRDALIMTQGDGVHALHLTLSETDKVLGMSGWNKEQKLKLGANILQNTLGLGTARRVRAASWLVDTTAPIIADQAIRNWLSNDGPNAGEYGDLRLLRDLGVNLPESTISTAYYRGTYSKKSSWTHEYAVESTDLWKRGNDPSLNVHVHEVAKDRLGEDLEAWDMFLALMPDWEGNLLDLLDTIQNLK